MKVQISPGKPVSFDQLHDAALPKNQPELGLRRFSSSAGGVYDLTAMKVSPADQQRILTIDGVTEVVPETPAPAMTEAPAPTGQEG